MAISEATYADGIVTLAGRVTRPLARPARAITLKRRVSCRSGYRTVRTFRPRSDGTFRVTVPGPPPGEAGVYRLETKVRKTARNPKLYPTFTLPSFVELGDADAS